MPENLRVIFEHALPFVAAAANGEKPQLNTARILEQLLLAAVLTAGAALWLVPTIESKLGAISEDVHEMGQDLKEVKSDVVQLKIDAAVERARHEKERVGP